MSRKEQSNPVFLICLFLIMGVSVVLVLTGIAILIEIIPPSTTTAESDHVELYLIVAGLILMVVGILLALGVRPKKIGYGKYSIELSQATTYAETTTQLSGELRQKTLRQEDFEQRALYAETKQLPGQSEHEYSAVQLTKVNRLLVIPSAQPMTPMYILDQDYRILDWNEAFSLAFDRTMEGRQGQSILEWTYLLDNYQEVLDHGEQVFSNPKQLPVIDVESVEYTSLRYGPIKAVKRAFQIPDDQGKCFAWLITIDLDFINPNEKSRFKYELLRLNGLEQLWSEYAISYDRVLVNTRVYRDLIDSLLGIGESPLSEIDVDAKVLDIGAGTGNVSRRLMDGHSRRTVFAVDKNRIMLEFLRDKCNKFLIEDDFKPGILAVKQDVSTLYGLPDNYFDCVVANNVIYALADPDACLEAVFRVLKPGGEFRMSGPRNDTDLTILFERIKDDLQKAGKYNEFQAEYNHVEQINTLRLKSMLHKWTTSEFCKRLINKGYRVTHSSEDVYANQSMLIAALKPDTETSVVNYKIKPQYTR